MGRRDRVHDVGHRLGNHGAGDCVGHQRQARGAATDVEQGKSKKLKGKSRRLQVAGVCPFNPMLSVVQWRGWRAGVRRRKNGFPTQLLRETHPHWDGTVFRPAEPLTLEPNTRVWIVIETTLPPTDTARSFLRTARSLNLAKISHLQS